MKPGSTIQIGLLWHSPNSGNLGVGALTLGNMAILREAAEAQGLIPRFTIIGMRDRGRRYPGLEDVAVIDIDSSLIRPGNAYARALRHLDVVFDIGAGDSFTDIYGAKRFFYLWMTKWMAYRAGVPLVFSPQTIGPFTGMLYRRLARAVMRPAKALITRDTRSTEAVHDLVPGLPVTEAVDVAFVLPFTRPARSGDGKVQVGINASGLLFRQNEPGARQFGLSYDYAEATRRFIRALLDRGDCTVHLVPHATSNVDPADDDGALAEKLAAEFPGTIRVPDFAGPCEAKSYIAGLDVLVAARMHACIGAFSAGTTVLPVAYSRKFTGLFGMLGYDHLVPVTGVTTEEAAAMMLASVDRREALALQSAAAMETVQQRLHPYRDLLASVFATLPEKVA